MLPMRVEGPRLLAVDPLGVLAAGHLQPIGAPGNFISCTVRRGMSRSVATGRRSGWPSREATCMTVTPPAMASGICGSCGQNECSAHTCGGVRVGGLVAVAGLGVPGAA